MANEIEKTIEELEAEVLSELEEQTAADAAKKGAAPAEAGIKASDASAVTPGGQVDDLGPAVQHPFDKKTSAHKADTEADEKKGDSAQKSELAPEVGNQTPYDGEKKVAQPLASGDNKEPKEGQEIIAEKDTEEVKEVSKEDMIKAMKDMPEELIRAAFDKMNKESKDEEVSDEDKEKEALQKEAVEQRIKEIDVTEHVEALMSGEGDLTDDFKKKAATVFESAVKSKVRNEVTRLQENYDKELEEATKSIKSELSEKVDTYLNYVVEEWMKDNQLAVERGLKGEIAEDFIAGLKQLFEDHYVDIPDEKYDVLQAQSDKIAELEEKVNKTLDESMELKKSKDSLTRNKVMSESTSDLADTEIEKFKELTQDVDFDNEDNFKGKLDTLKESYFPKVKKESSETIDNVATGPAQDIDMSDSMAAYTKAISHAEAENVKGATK